MILLKEDITDKVPGLTSIFVEFKFNQDIIDVIKTLPCYNYSKKTHLWEVPLSSLSDLIEMLNPYDDIELRLLEYNDDTTLDNIEIHKHKTNPFPYQKEGIQYGLCHNKWLLLDPPGLGKTLQITYIAEELYKKGEIEHCLVICGLNSLKTNWKKEIQKHSELSCTILGERTTRTGNVVFGSISDRLKHLSNPIDEFFIITNVETIRDDKIVDAIMNGVNKIDMIVVDEIHQCKSPTSIQGKNLLKLSKCKYQIGATGTLLLNSPIDSYVPLKWIEAERAPMSRFKSYYSVYGGLFGNDFLGYKNLSTLKHQLSRVSLRRDKSLLELPEKNIIIEYVDMDDLQRKFYNDVKNGVKEEVEKVVLKPTIVLSLVMRLRQATANPKVLTTKDIKSAKIERCKSLVEEILDSGHKVVVFCTFKDSVYALDECLKEFNPLLCTGDIDDKTLSQYVDEFQNNEQRKVLIGTWQKCGTGLTLTAANYMIFIDTPWTNASFEQACDRIYRIGTKEPVFIYNLVTSDTVDEKVLDIVQDKKAIADYIVDDEISVDNIAKLQKYVEELR